MTEKQFATRHELKDSGWILIEDRPLKLYRCKNGYVYLRGDADRPVTPPPNRKIYQRRMDAERALNVQVSQ